MGKFKVGDVVVLKSGGPDMTVMEYENATLVHVHWFLSTGENRGTNYFEDELEKAVTMNHSSEQL